MSVSLPPSGASPRILVLRRHNHVGDMLCSLPLYAALRNRWPGARIDLLATPTRYPVPLRELNPFIDEVTWYRKGTVAEVLRVHRDLRSRRYDIAIVPSTVAVSRTSHITAFLTGADIRIGVRSVDGEANGAQALLNVKADLRWNAERVHQEDRNLEIARLAGCAIEETDMRTLRIPFDAAAEAAAHAALGAFADGRPLLGVHPGAGKAANVWPTERFAETIKAVHVSGPLAGAGVVITAGALDAAEVSRLETLLHEAGIEAIILRELPVPALSAVFRRLVLHITNDTGTMHIAAYSGCPTVSLFGPTHAWEWAPRGPRHRAIVSPDGRMEGIEIGRVVEEVGQVVNDK